MRQIEHNHSPSVEEADAGSALARRSASARRAAIATPPDPSSEQSLATGPLIGRSPVFLEALDTIERLAELEITVLVCGETGTGKELVARAMHYQGPRRCGPFIAVNCGAIPDGLLESELFGHDRGAFTDAHRAHVGLATRADGGTLFLDEVDSLSPKGQVALLRFLQDRVCRPLGARAAHSVNVRVVSACNGDLPALVASGRFRSDLMFRLGVVLLRLPPLRERGEDVQLLADHFVQLYSGRDEPRRLSDEVRRTLRGHDWPGNIRELENFIQAACALSRGPEVTLPGRAVGGIVAGNGERAPSSAEADEALYERGFHDAKARVIADFEQRYLERLLSRAGGNVTRAAALAGKERRALGKLLKKHGLRGSL